MKKSIGLISLTLTLCLTLLFVGCGNTSKTLAKNLDNTVTNLIYSVSSLDWADSSVLANISGKTESSYDSNLNYFNDFTFMHDESEPNYNDFNDNQNQITDHAFIILNTSENSTQENINNNIDNYTIENKDSNIKPDNNSINKIDNITTKNNQTTNTKTYNRNINNQNQTYQYNSTNNMSGFNQNRSTFSNDTVSNINTNTNLAKTPFKAVDYSTTNIEDSSIEIQNKITELIEKRSNVLLYINDLYKGNVNLNNDSVRAINAYINIIKDNTSYLNRNKGIIINQLSQANKLVEADENSPLINAYIIRTAEAIDTRIAKLDSSIYAIESICNIIEANLTNKSLNYNATNNISNSKTINNNNLITKNNNAETKVNNNKNRSTTSINRNNLKNNNKRNYPNNNIYRNNINNRNLNNNQNDNMTNKFNTYKNNSLSTNTLNKKNNLNNSNTNAINNNLSNTELNSNINNNTNYTNNRFSNNTGAKIINEEKQNSTCIDCPDCISINDCSDCKNCKYITDYKDYNNNYICFDCDPANPSDCKVCIPNEQLKTNSLNNKNLKENNNKTVRDTKEIITNNNNLDNNKKYENNINTLGVNEKKLESNNEKTIATFSNFLDKKHREKEALHTNNSLINSNTNIMY